MFAKSTRATRLIAVLNLALGAGWIWFTLINPLLHPLVPTQSATARPILVFTLLVVSLPGFFCIYSGVDLLRHVRTASIKGAAGSMLAALVICVAALVGLLDARNSFLWSGALFAGTLLAIPVYLAVCKSLLRREGFVVPGTKDLLGKVAVLLLALQIWWLASVLFTTYSPRQAEDPDLLAQPWPTVGLVIPIIVAIAFYKFTNLALGNSKPRPAPVHEAH